MTELLTVIATAGRPDLLARTLSSLAECERPAGYAGTLVIENGGRHGAEAVVGRAPAELSCRYLFHANGNKSEALNSALPMMGGGLVFFTDDDVRFAPETLRVYAEAAADGNGRYFGGPTGVDYEREPPACLKKYLPLSARGWSPTLLQQQDPEMSFLGFNWAAFAGDIRAAGGFDANRGPGAATGGTGQEGEMQARLRRAGLKPAFVPAAKVWHYIPAERCSVEWVVNRAYRHGVSYALDSKNRGKSLFGCPPWVAGRVVRSVLRRAAALLSFSPDFELEARTKHSYNRGLVDGFRLQGAR